MSASNPTVTDWIPTADMAQGMGSDGSDGDGLWRWKHFCGDKLMDGQGNEISMTEAIQLLLQLKAANNG